ncbi:MAG: sugar ABC transporter permease [Bacilli bacterium]|nr:sugar ABC transporter permease [Bacilli bacterium]
MAEGKVKKLRILNWKIQTQIAGWAFVSLPILGFLLFQAVPLFFSLFVSFTQYDFFTGEFTWVGFENYVRAFHDRYFLFSLENTALALLGLGVQVVVALLLAMLLTANVKGQPIFRAFFFVPTLCSSVAVTLVWKWMFNVDFGILNSILGAFGIPPIGWLTDPNISMVSMIIQGVWMGAGSGMVMYVAALSNAPKELYEAAEIDGANAIQKFFHITIPTISPTTFFILATSLIGTMTDFARYRLMTDGGPSSSTLTTALYIYQTAFTSTYEYDYSYATAMSWLLGVAIIILVAMLFLSSKKWVHYKD